MKYFRIVIDSAARDVWFLDEPISKEGEPIDAREFTQGRPYSGPPPYRVPISQPGRIVDVSLAAFDMPVVSRRVGTVVDQFPGASVERFPVVVGSIGPGYEILNVTATAECLDEEQSDIMRWTPVDGRPDKVGQYRMITNLTIDPGRTGTMDIFRVKGWEIALIVSEELKRRIEEAFDLGVTFQPVC